MANRVGEIGTLRALAFPRGSVLAAFLLEAVFLGLLGGVTGLAFASFLQFFTISTMNWQTFSDLAFRFALTPEMVVRSLRFSLIMGFVGGLLPAVRAARMTMVEALRAA